MLRNLILAAIFCVALAGVSYGQKERPKENKSPRESYPVEKRPIEKPDPVEKRPIEKPIEKPERKPSEKPGPEPREQKVWAIIENKTKLPFKEIQ